MVEHLRVIRTMKSWDETITREVENGPKITNSVAKYELAGAIEGDSTVDYSMVYVSSSQAIFLGYELVHGTIAGRRGAFALRHEGTFESGTATIEVQVVPKTGTGALANLSGSGRITADSTDPMRATLVLDVELP